MEQITHSANTQHMQDKQRIRPSKHRFVKGMSCLTNLSSLFDWVTLSVDDRKTVASV